MSKCISHHGEYGEHELDATGDHRFVCKRCWVLDEDGILAALDAAEARAVAAEAALAKQQKRIDRVIEFRNSALDTSQSPWLGKEVVSALDAALGAVVGGDET